MEPDFSALGERERIARCLELAQAQLDRANACRNAKTRDLHQSLAECWRSMARQFESLSSLRAEISNESGDHRTTRPLASSAFGEFDLRATKRFAT
jgi:hypothetical protein